MAHGWSHYFQDFIKHLWHPDQTKVFSNAPFDYDLISGKLASTGTYFDLPAVLITVAITIDPGHGDQGERTFNATMVIVKLAVVLFVIVVGATYIHADELDAVRPVRLHRDQLLRSAVAGQDRQRGASRSGCSPGPATIFFAYIGFDAVSTQSEEAKNPKRDVPIGIIVSLVLCTVLYIAVAAVLTGMIRYDKINIDAPVSDAFGQVGLPWAKYLISLGALTGITSVLLVMMLSQPRVFLAMARDGLVPPAFFGAIHPRVPDPLEVDHPDRRLRRR